ncbi:LysR family transcriptional regulator [Piscinibacter terrae]|uniref:LysR family transcriptional regulator n=1 Tax=Piscinibacter terrae TaxID=2496871 RepID=A0A3N7HQ43_9BURK|nr:LysR family transcriptional regulator [Albitalea terrae]RQP24348.1 LysR family transcriptional regulator [Albitalea terrae]
MKLTQLDGLVAFVMVANKRSFTAAAAALEVTPPAVSQAVKQLEEKLGVRLLHRTTRSVGLTDAGERYLGRVGPAVDELLSASTELEPYRDGLSGQLRINAPQVVYHMLLKKPLASFLAKHPAVRIELTLNDGFVDIAAGGYDAGIRLGESVQRDMVAVPLTRSERTCLVASPAYVKRKGLPSTIEDLKHHDCIRYRFPASGAMYRWELRRKGRLVEAEVDGPLTVSDSMSMSQAAMEGIGIAYTFEREVAQALKSGRLVPVLSSAWHVQPGFHFYYPSRRQLPASLRAFMGHCAMEAAD